MLVRINISRSFTKSQWFSFSTKEETEVVNQRPHRTIIGVFVFYLGPSHFNGGNQRKFPSSGVKYRKLYFNCRYPLYWNLMSLIIPFIFFSKMPHNVHSLTLYRSPWILARFDHLVPNFHLFGAPNDSERQMTESKKIQIIKTWDVPTIL